MTKLIHVQTDSPVVEFKDGQPLFYDRILEIQMKREGIRIPPFLQKEFGGKRRVRIGDPEFLKAFREVYYNLSFDHTLYRWQ